MAYNRLLCLQTHSNVCTSGLFDVVFSVSRNRIMYISRFYAKEYATSNSKILPHLCSLLPLTLARENITTYVNKNMQCNDQLMKHRASLNPLWTVYAWTDWCCTFHRENGFTRIKLTRFHYLQCMSTDILIAEYALIKFQTNINENSLMNWRKPFRFFNKCSPLFNVFPFTFKVYW